MNSITVTEQHRLGDKVLVRAESYDRYVDASAWDEDPEAVAADIAAYLNAQHVYETITPPVKKNPITLTARQVEVKLAAIAVAKKAEESEKSETIPS